MQALKGEAALKQVSHKVQVQLGVNHKEEILKASSKGQAPREEVHRLRNSEEALKVAQQQAQADIAAATKKAEAKIGEATKRAIMPPIECPTTTTPRGAVAYWDSTNGIVLQTKRACAARSLLLE